MPLFAEVIVPLALPQNLTWSVPQELEGQIMPGMRVVVPLGNKLLTGLVFSLISEAPTGYKVKPIDSVLDTMPLVNERQLELWEWMANYYLCSLGEVMAAALPGSLKLSSESKIVLNPDYIDSGHDLNDKELRLFDALHVRKSLMFSEIPEILGIKTIHPVLKSMLEKGAIEMEEELRYKFRPKKEDFVRFTELILDEESMHAIFDQLEKRAPKQLDLLLHMYRLGGSRKMELIVPKKELFSISGANQAILKGLADKGVVEIFQEEVGRLSADDDGGLLMPELSEAQRVAFDEIRGHWQDKEVVLLQGVTGSGKTEVYIRLIEETLEKGRQVLYLLPEIALTSQIITRLQRHFGDAVGIYHSKFNLNERAEVWYRTMSQGEDQFKVILGARSSMFLPFSDLGLIIVDEEHEHTFKQQDPAPRYNARDMSVILGKIHKGKVLMGTATPSIESYWNAERGRYGLVQLSERYGGMQLPEIFCADFRKDIKEKSMHGNFTSMLLEAIKETLANGEQVILFQNRRGYAPLWQCETCGWIPECSRCDVSLTYHKRSHLLRCHYCGMEAKPPSSCAACMSKELKMLGFGTEKIEEELQDLIGEEYPIGRLDLDTTRSKTAYQNILEDFRHGKLKVLVGTQMVTKGLDFDHVGLVGVLNADLMLKFPDFRSHERAYQLMSQVAGRAGRKHKRGKVIIQTYDPDHWVLRRVIEHDYEGLYKHELIERRNFHYPPFYRLVLLDVRHRDGEKADRAAYLLASRLRTSFGDRVLGPERPYISRINNIHHVHVLIKFERELSPSKIKSRVLSTVDSVLYEADFKGLKIVPDVDPM